MSQEEMLKRIRNQWLGEKDPIARDIQLATVAIGLHPNLIEIIPGKTFPISNWKVAQKYLLDTSAANTMRLSGLLMMVAAGIAIWFCFFTSLRWYLGVGGAICLLALTTKMQYSMRSAAILNGVMESPIVFTRLWELQAFALRVNGNIYEPTNDRNSWQDVVFLALGLNDLIVERPLTRDEMLDEILSKVGLVG